MNPNHLLTFAVVAKLKSITRAAEILHLGQPAVSGQLKLLQNEIGEPLYERKGFQIELTPAGVGLLEYAKKMTDSLQQADDYVRSLQKVNAGTLRLGSTTTISSYYLPRYLVQLQRLHSGVHVNMRTGDTHEILKGLQTLDLGFIESIGQEIDLPTAYELVPWQEDEIVLVLPEYHELANRYPECVPLEVFAQHEVIWREPGSGSRQVVERALLMAGIDVSVNIEVTGVSGIKEAVRAGLGIGFTSSKALLNERKGLVARHVGSNKGLSWQLCIIAPKPILRSRVAKTFLELCLSQTKPLENAS